MTIKRRSPSRVTRWFPRGDGRRPRPVAFTLVELVVTLAIVAILASLALAGLAVSQRQVRVVRTETTIRKIHEVVMPHYERYVNRTVSQLLPPEAGVVGIPTASELNVIRNCRTLIAKRRLMALEMPDGWNDLRGTWNDANDALQTELSLYPANQLVAPQYTAIAMRMRNLAAGLPVAMDLRNADAECLWAMVIRGGFADPAIVGHFREDEFGDTNRNGQREFIDGWGRPIRFLRWAPGFVSRYQPDSASHDAFDPAGLDPLATRTLFPLVFSLGADGEAGIAYRNNEGTLNSPLFRYHRVAYDPYFVVRSEPVHLKPLRLSGQPLAWIGQYAEPLPQYRTEFGYLLPEAGPAAADNIHNHAMSR